MKKMCESIVRALTAKQAVILVSVLASSGSTPRGAGARMLVFEDGHTEGTIGGGVVEYAAFQHACRLLKEQDSDLVGYCLTKNDTADLGMICGGDVTVYFQCLRGEETLPLFRHLEDAYVQNRPSWLVRKMEQKKVTAMAVRDPEGFHFDEGFSAADRKILPELIRPGAVYRPGEPAYCADPIISGGIVCLFGGGHVSQALVPALARVDFSPIVFEDRPAFANPALFPDAKKVILGDFGRISDSITLTDQDYAVIMTRGHQADFEVLAQVLSLPLSYIGCIGSRKKIAATRERLRALGYPDHAFDRVHAPIGLDILAETPQEIAVSVTAELIRHRAAQKIKPI